MRRILFVFMLASTVLIRLYSQTAVAPTIGYGTETYPYEISTLGNLYWIAENPDRWIYTYIQTEDIDASSTSGWFSDGSGGFYGWPPIGDAATAFTGNYKGQNYTVSGLYINRPSSDYTGLFGYTSGAAITNLQVTDVDIVSNNYSGGLTGYASSSTITGCNTTGIITASGNNIGGLAGWTENNTQISSCFSECEVHGNASVGGLVGLNHTEADIYNSYASGTVFGAEATGGLVGCSAWTNIISGCFSKGNVTGTGGTYTGGFIGYNYMGTYIVNCYSLGDVTGGYYGGGFIGMNHSSTTEKCYSAGAVSAVTGAAGGFCGYQHSGEIAKSFWDIDSSTLSGSSGGTGLFTSDMKSYTSYFISGWDCAGESINGTTDIWGINETGSENEGYPFLSWQGYTNNPLNPVVQSLQVSDIASTTASGNGNIVLLGASNPTQYGMCWNTSGDPTIADSRSEEGSISATGAFVSVMTGLLPGTLYYAKPYATNASGTSYGTQISFMTTPVDAVLPSGSGTVDDPYLISTLQELYWITENSSRWAYYYKQTADIDASSTSTWFPDGAKGFYGWPPVGDASVAFTGNYNGQDFSISGLFINRPATDYVGLFGNTTATISNIRLPGANVTGQNYTGILIGHSVSSQITNCSSSGNLYGINNTGGLVGMLDQYSSISGSSSSAAVSGVSEVGGLIGYAYNGCSISLSYASGTVTGSGYYIGGISGYNVYSSTVNSCFFNGSVTSPSGTYVGGITGLNDNSSAIMNCYSTGAVDGGNYAGGFVGFNQTYATVTNCYSSGPVTSSGSVGGFAAYNAYMITGCYWDTETSGQAASSGGTGKTTAEMKIQALYFNTGWDLTQESVNGTADYWGIDETGAENSGYPFLTWQGFTHTATRPLVVFKSITDLKSTSFIANGSFTEWGNSDITKHGVCWNTTGEPTIAEPTFTDEGPLTSVSGPDFSTQATGLLPGITYYAKIYAQNGSGTVYGNQMSFTTLSIDSEQPAGSGTSDDPYLIASLANLYWIAESSARWAYYYKQTADIDASSTSSWYQDGSKGFYGWPTIGDASVAFTGNYNGQNYTITGLYINRPATDFIGLFGNTSGAVLSNIILNNANITGKDNTGALGGQLYSTQINNCASSGIVNGGSNVGGLTGILNTNSNVSWCSSSAAVNGTGNEIGGLSGYNYSSCSITGSFASGTVTGSGSYIGGFVGFNQYSSTVSSCIFSGSVTSPAGVYVGGFVGFNDSSAGIYDCYSTGSVDGGNSVGGFVGWNNSYSVITRCYSTGAVTAGVSPGGFAAFDYAQISSCFWDTETSGQATSYSGTGKTSAEMKVQAMYFNSGWDLAGEDVNGSSNIWGINETGAENSGYPFLAWQGFTHTAERPLVQSLAVSGILDTSASGNGNIIALGSADPTQYGVCWNTTGDPTTSDSKTEEGTISVTGSYTTQMTGLLAGTIYFVKAYATNASGTVYGNQVSFTTLSISAELPAGSGTETDPYLIANLNNLYWVAENSSRWSYYYKQTADIDATPTSGWYPDGAKGYYGWSQIGDGTIGFSGNYNGQNYTINGLYINRPSTDYIGLFGNTNGAVVNNLNLSNVNISGHSNTGALIGQAYQSQINNCSSSGIVNGYDNTGGITGVNTYYTSLTGCYTSAAVTGSNNDTGGVTGYNYNGSSVSGCYSNGSVTGGFYNTGGLVGVNQYSSSVRSSFAVCSVNSSGYYVGGLAGLNEYSSVISNSYSQGSVNGGESAGGLIGLNQIYGEVINCYSSSNVSSAGTAGGLIATNGGSVFKSFWDTDASGQASSAGGEGKTTPEMKKQPLYFNAGWDMVQEEINGTAEVWGIDETGAGNSGYPFLAWQGIAHSAVRPLVYLQSVSGISSTSASVRSTAVALGATNPSHSGVCWNTTGEPVIGELNFTDEGALTSLGDFTSVMTGLMPGVTYYIKTYAINSADTTYSNQTSILTLPMDPVLPSGTGTADDPYMIASLANLYWIASDNSRWGYHYIQTENIDAAPTASWYPDGSKGYYGWTPIGDWATAFTGTYEGQGFAIDGLVINRPVQDYIGLFGNTSSATVKNLLIKGGMISGNNYVGSLAGQMYSSAVTGCSSEVSVSGVSYTGGLIGINNYYSTVTSCSSSGTVYGSGDCTGGLIGNNYNNSAVSKSYSWASVSGSNSTGGLTGHIYASSVTDSYASGSCTGVNYTGGLTGSADYYSSIGNCFAKGNVHGDHYTGGLAGNLSDNSSVGYCYSKGTVTGTDNLGGLIGYNSASNVTASFWDIQTSGLIYSAGGTDKITSEMTALSTFTDSGWDFTEESVNGMNDYWSIHPVHNNGYPYLSWMDYTGIETVENMPEKTDLFQNYPNPFNPSTTIKFALAEEGKVRLAVYNYKGQLVKEIRSGQYEAGYHEVIFDASGISSGLYFYILEAPGSRFIKKMTIMK